LKPEEILEKGYDAVALKIVRSYWSRQNRVGASRRL